jgi:hypothetical protein
VPADRAGGVEVALMRRMITLRGRRRLREDLLAAATSR